MKRSGTDSPWASVPPTCVACLVLTMIIIGAGTVTFRHHGGGDHVSNLVNRLGGGSTGSEIIRRFHGAEEHVRRMRDFGKHELFTVTNCPKEYGLGRRSNRQDPPYYSGNLCEPWMSRFAIVMLDQLLDPNMRALEWGSGASSQWLLMRVGHLTSIEHDSAWVPMVRDGLAQMFGAQFLAAHWDSHDVPRGKPSKEGADEVHDPDSFGEYVSADFLPKQTGIFDYIAVDGRSRVACLKRALPLLKSEGGILLLDNSDRKYYAEAFEAVPSHWLRFDDTIDKTSERTTIWVSCRPGACGDAIASPSGSSGSEDDTPPE